MKIIERTFDATTGETTDVERNATSEEIATREKLIAEAQAKAEADAIKATEKAALLAKLGITDDEAKLLLS
jgi:hypothetical protein